jgi:ribulose-5-phosphate 4-epimerase/fuculose-1-phosphate aldolase
MAGLVERQPAADPGMAARIDFAAAFRLAARLGLPEGICNHVSLAVPGMHDRFLLNPDGLHWSQIRAGDLLGVDAAGEVLAGRATAEATAFFNHSRLRRGNARADCVMHTHVSQATALATLANDRLDWLSQTSAKFYSRVAYYDEYNGLALDDAEGDRIGDALADKSVLRLANHGVIVTAATVAQAFEDLYYLERACELQLLAYSAGRPLRRQPDAVVRLTAQQRRADAGSAIDHFAALKDLLDRDEPDCERGRWTP